MNRPFPHRLISAAVASLVSGVLLAACGGSGEPIAPTVPADAPLAPTPNATETARQLIDTAESAYMAHMTVEMHELVRLQPWFGDLTQDHVDLIAAILRTERAAKAKGEADSILDMLTFASE